MNEFLEKVIKNGQYYGKKILLLARKLRYKIQPVHLQQPIFVVGCSRAGSTLVYKTFSEAASLGSLQRETHDFWAKLQPIAKRNWESHAIPQHLATKNKRAAVEQYFYTQTGQRRIVDKNNQNGLSIAYLYQLFPDAHFVYIKRSAGDNINSLIHGWNKADEFATWSADLPKKVAIEQGKYQRWCFFLTKGWQDYCHQPIEAVCAFQYQTMNRAILTAKVAIPTTQWHEISYETLIEKPVSEFKQLFEVCGVEFDANLREHCEQVLQKPYNTFSEIKVDKWKTGENSQKISTILNEIEDVVIDMGYKK